MLFTGRPLLEGVSDPYRLPWIPCSLLWSSQFQYWKVLPADPWLKYQQFWLFPETFRSDLLGSCHCWSRQNRGMESIKASAYNICPSHPFLSFYIPSRSPSDPAYEETIDVDTDLSGLHCPSVYWRNICADHPGHAVPSSEISWYPNRASQTWTGLVAGKTISEPFIFCFYRTLPACLWSNSRITTLSNLTIGWQFEWNVAVESTCIFWRDF